MAGRTQTDSGAVLRAYIPEAIPVTCGLDSLRRLKGTGGSFREFLRDRFSSGYVIKQRWGILQGNKVPARHNPELVIDSTAEPDPFAPRIADEKHVVQERLGDHHGVSGPQPGAGRNRGLTFRRYEAGGISNERDAPRIRAIFAEPSSGRAGGRFPAGVGHRIAAIRRFSRHRSEFQRVPSGVQARVSLQRLFS